MFKKHRRSTNPLFIIFRLILSLFMFAVLLGGIYAAYKHFSGVDPLKLDPQALTNLIQAKTPKQLVGILGQFTKKENPISLDNLTPKKTPTSTPSFKFLLVADSHNDNANLSKAISQAKKSYPDAAFIIGLGDYSDVGTIRELTEAKKELDSSGLRYFLVAGDHDLWDSRNRDLPPDTDFKEVFGPTFQSFVFDNFLFLLLDNSDNYKGISEEQSKWITNQLEKAKQDQVKGIFIFIHEPLYHPSSDHAMGKVDKNLKSQAQSLIRQLADGEVKKVIAGDIHYFSEYEEPETKLPMITIGAIVSERNPQAPRYGIVSVFEDGASKVDDVEIK